MAELDKGLRQDAELIVGLCMSVEEGDTVTIITDNDHLTEADALAQIVVERGGFPVVMNNEYQVKKAIADMTFPMAPPKNLHQAMVNSDEIIIITNLEWANRFAHVSAVRESCDNNAKIASVEEGIGSWNLTEADILDATNRAVAAIEAMKGAKWCHVTSPAGTDLRVNIEGRPALQVTPIKKRGQMMGPIPLWSEVAFAAVEDKTEGRVVVDGIMLGIGLPGQTPNPIEWRVEKGKAVAIEGGEEAEKLKKVIAGVDGATVIGEFAFGTSEKSPTGSPSEKGLLGTVHFALGDNHNAYPGGQNVSKLHLDGNCLNASLMVEDTGVYIVKDGKWAL